MEIAEMTKLDAACDCNRRTFLRRSLAGLGATAAATTSLPWLLTRTNEALASQGSSEGRILVILELAGGNDGLNTFVPHGHDEYYKARPTLAIGKDRVIRLDDEFGLHPNLLGFEHLFKDGKMAVVHGCGYPNPNRSHFESMKFWNSGVPGDPQYPTGWVARVGNTLKAEPTGGFVVNVADRQSDALRGSVHPAVVFADPERYRRDGSDAQKAVFAQLSSERPKTGNVRYDFVRQVATTADTSSDFVRTACAEYRAANNFGYGAIGRQLTQITALIAKGGPARIYYTTMGGFDTHVGQAGAHGGLFNTLGDALLGFQRDITAIGRADDVSMLVFTEFGRRVQENASAGTDHGVAGPMYLVGSKVKGGFHGTFPSLTDLDAGDLKQTTDFRSVYATVIRDWLGIADTKSILREEFPTLGLFA
jgi:uncharacterized protein (DUF1501 family)